jgi:L-fucose isomerase-like protein
MAINQKKSTFVVYLGTRGFFPAQLMATARAELTKILKDLGHDTIMLDASATHHGAVETVKEGKIFAEFLRTHHGKYDGIILSLPNFGDENGAAEAMRNAGVPIFVQAYPDEMDKMAPSTRRDSFCGKISVMDVFCQNGIKFTALKPHTVSPSSERFKENIKYFDAVCRVVKGIRGMVVGAIGARATPFKTVRIDEVALQQHGITVETLDLSDVFKRMEKLTEDAAYKAKKNKLNEIASWEGIPAAAQDNVIRAGVVLDQLIDEYEMDAVSLRCWIEFQKYLGMSPCVLFSELNDRGIAAACEVDIGNAVTMRALQLASYAPPICLDWNNNYGDDDDKCILFHCGPVPSSLMTGKGKISDHMIVACGMGPGCGFGCNVGRIKPTPFTFGSMMSVKGRLSLYLGKGQFTSDSIPENFFGCAGVAKIDKLQDVLLHIGNNGHRHHVSCTPGDVVAPVREALSNYLNMEVAVPQETC